MIEGDEYDSAFFDKTAKFLKYLPDIAVINNVEYDHADIYPDLESIRVAFRRFVNLIPRRGLLLVGADDPEARALAANANRFAIFGYAKGDQMVGLVAPARRAAFAIRETLAANLTAYSSLTGRPYAPTAPSCR